jgi:8-oxo-dGTP diphosphatase
MRNIGMRPQVGVGVIVLNGDKIIFGKRKGAHCKGTWSIPGGHLEFGESPEECAIREVFEETGVKIMNPRFRTVANNVLEGKHYITIIMESDAFEGDPKTTEPDKYIDVGWYLLNDLPSPIFTPAERGLECFKENRHY